MRQRDPRIRDKGYLAWLHDWPCIACLTLNAKQLSPTEAAHVKCGYPEAGWRDFGGGERSHDWRAVPLCTSHHREGPDSQHAHKERDWWDALGIYPPSLCAALRALYTGDALTVLQAFASEAQPIRHACQTQLMVEADRRLADPRPIASWQNPPRKALVKRRLGG